MILCPNLAPSSSYLCFPVYAYKDNKIVQLLFSLFISSYINIVCQSCSEAWWSSEYITHLCSTSQDLDWMADLKFVSLIGFKHGCVHIVIKGYGSLKMPEN